MTTSHHDPGSPDDPVPDDQEVYGELSEGLRTLAMRLVREESTADDVVQEAWLAALDARPDQVRDLTSWLRKVVRNLARRTHARSARRREIEALVARPEALSQDAEVEARSTRRMLIESIGRLKDPYRTVLTLRYIDGLDARQIAERRGNTPASVRSQIQRGLAKLRAAFDRTHEGRRKEWAQILLPFATQHTGSHPPADPVQPRGADAPTAPGVSIAAPRSRWVLPLGMAATAAVVATVVLWRALGPEPEVLAVAPRPDVARTTSVREEITGAPALGERASRPTEVPESSQPATASEPMRSLEVVLRRQDGTPAIEGYVSLNGPDGRPIATADYPEGFLQTDLDGRATFAIPERELEGEPWFPAGSLGVHVGGHDRDEAWSVTRRVVVPESGGTVTLYCRGPIQDLVLTLVDEGGAPLNGSVVILHSDRLTGLRGHDTTELLEPPRYYISDDRGTVNVYWMPTRDHRLAVFAPGKPRMDWIVSGDDRVLAETLVVPDGHSIYGRILLPDSSPAANARVWSSDPVTERESGRIATETLADPDGYFELPGIGLGPQRLFANAPGNVRISASTILDVRPHEEMVWEPTLAEGAPVRVRMVDESGEPLPGATVTLIHPGPPVWASAAKANSEGRVAFWQVPPGPLELIGSKDDRVVNPTVVTGVTGHADELEILVRTSEIGGGVRGSIHDADGAPLPNASIVLSGGGSFRSFDSLTDLGTGEFSLRDLPPGRYEVAVRVTGMGQHLIGEHEIRTGAELDLGEIRIPSPVQVMPAWGNARPSRAGIWRITADLAGIAEPFLVRSLKAPDATLQLIPGRYRIGPLAPGGSETEFTVPRGSVGIAIPLEIR